MKYEFAVFTLAGCFLWIVGCDKPVYVWQRAFTDDQRASAEFPCPTTTETATDSAKGVSVKRTTVTCSIPHRDITLHLSYSEIPPEGAGLTVEQRVAAIRSHFEQQGCTIVSCVSEMTGNVPGCRMVIQMDHGKTRCTVRLAVTPKAIYRALATSASVLHNDPAIARFVESFSVAPASLRSGKNGGGGRAGAPPWAARPGKQR